MKIYRFGNCLLNAFERQVRKDGRWLKMTPRTFDVLLVLVERAGQVVTKDELLETVWAGTFVEEGNLPVHISKLRHLLKATVAKRFIETVHCTGYRFVSTVRRTGYGEWLAACGGGHDFSAGNRLGEDLDAHTRTELDKIARLLIAAVSVLRSLPMAKSRAMTPYN